MPALNEALPAEIAGSGHSWFTRYRRFPVFSPAWARGRVRVWFSVTFTVLALILLSFSTEVGADVPYGGLLQLAVQLLVPIVLGPWLCAWVRNQAWPPAREGWALVLALAGLVAVVMAYHVFLDEPVKQALAEASGNVDENGKRRRTIMSLGLSVTRPDAPSASKTAGHAASGLASGISSAPAPTAVAASAGLRAQAHTAAASGRPVSSPVTNAISSVLLSFSLGGGVGLLAWRRQLEGLRALAQARELARAQAQRREAELRLSVLAAQVEPHFLFNTLAGVRSAISTDPGRASEMIDRLVDYLRAAIPRLRSDGGADATLGSQLEIVRAYLGLMRARMPRLSFDIDAPAELLTLPFPPLMLISLAENAVKHGVEPKVGPVQVQLRARREEDGRLSVCVSDDGAGFDTQHSASGGGLGLSNIRERLAQMHGTRAELTLRARAPAGVSATLTVPLE